MAIVSYFVSERLAKGVLPKGRGITTTRKTVKTNHNIFIPSDTSLKGYVVKGPFSRMETWQKRNGFSYKDLLITPNGAVHLLGKDVDEAGVELDDDKGWLEPVPEVVKEMKSVLARFSAVTGYRFRIHFRNTTQVAPFPVEDGVIDVVLGSSPTGASKTLFTTSILGVRLKRDGGQVRRTGPSAGRGLVVGDGLETPFAQVVDSTIYLLVPVSSYDYLRLLDSDSGPGLFKRVFAPAWDVFLTRMKEVRSHVTKLSSVLSAESLARVLIAEHEKTIDDIYKNHLQTVEDRYTAYIDALRELEHAKMFAEASKIRGQKEYGRITESWLALKRQPYVASVSLADDALHVQTRVLFTEHAGKRYRLGSYVIRLSQQDGASVWAHKPAHPKGIAHPHISVDGSVCFGNVTRSIQEDTMSFELASAAETILSWLTQGYDPARADTKIEEWPLARRRNA